MYRYVRTRENGSVKVWVRDEFFSLNFGAILDETEDERSFAMQKLIIKVTLIDQLIFLNLVY